MNILRIASVLLVAFTIAACSGNQPTPLPEMTVWKSPSCGCCAKWIQHLQSSGFTIKVIDEPAMSPLKSSLGIAPEHQSCHTAKVGNYLVEGHVPAADILRLLQEKPAIIGLTVPGMPVGSPGMEMGDRFDPFDVIAIVSSSEQRVFARHDSADWETH